MKKISGGILFYKVVDEKYFFFLVHFGGPFFKNKDLGSWGIVKGQIEAGETPFESAIRECEEETGIQLKDVKFIDLGSVKKKGGKTVYCWGVNYDGEIKVNPDATVKLEWPPKSGQMLEFPENDRGEYFEEEEAIERINEAEMTFIIRLKESLDPIKIRNTSSEVPNKS